MIRCLAAALLGSMSVSALAAGTLVVAGGGLPDDSPIYNRFVDLATAAGNGGAAICIVGVNSADPEDSTGFYADIFTELGAATVVELDVTMANSAWNTEPVIAGDEGNFFFDFPEDEVRTTMGRLTEDPATVQALQGCSSFWFGGGNQNRGAFAFLNEDGSDTPAMAAIREAVADEGVFGGTSAGAALQSNPMIAGGDSIDSLSIPRGSFPVGTTFGFGLVPDSFLIDQHVFEFGRLGRLYVVMADLGLIQAAGVNNAAALEIDLDTNLWTVIGEDHAIIVEREAGETAREFTVHLLGAGDTYDPATGAITINEALSDITGDPFFAPDTIYQLGLFNPGVIQDVMTLVVDTIDTPSGAAIDFSGESAPVFQSSGVQMTFSETDATGAYLCFSGCRGDNPNRSGSYARYSVTDMQVAIDNIGVAVSTVSEEILPSYDFSTGIIDIPLLQVEQGGEDLGNWRIYLERTGPEVDTFNFDVGGAGELE